VRERLQLLSSHARVYVPPGTPATHDWSTPPGGSGRAGRRGCRAVHRDQALAVRQTRDLPVRLRGIDPRTRARSNASPRHRRRSLADLTPGSDRVIVAARLAQMLGLRIGDPITLLIPTKPMRTGTPQPRLREFTVAGVFNARCKTTTRRC